MRRIARSLPVACVGSLCASALAIGAGARGAERHRPDRQRARSDRRRPRRGCMRYQGRRRARRWTRCRTSRACAPGRSTRRPATARGRDGALLTGVQGPQRRRRDGRRDARDRLRAGHATRSAASPNAENHCPASGNGVAVADAARTRDRAEQGDRHRHDRPPDERPRGGGVSPTSAIATPSTTSRVRRCPGGAGFNANLGRGVDVMLGGVSAHVAAVRRGEAAARPARRARTGRRTADARLHVRRRT